MSPEDIRQQREAIAYIKDVKELILTDARAFYATQGLIHRALSYDVITSTYSGTYQATLIYYPDLGNDKRWCTLLEGCRCKDLCTAMKMLWDAVQTGLGDMKAMQYAHHAALISPVTTRSSNAEMEPRTPVETRERSISEQLARDEEKEDSVETEKA